MTQRKALEALLSSSIITIASSLYSKYVINGDVFAEARNPMHIAKNRTVSLLSVVEDKIRTEPNMFRVFVEVLESEPTLVTQANELVRNYLKGAVDRIISDVI